MVEDPMIDTGISSFDPLEQGTLSWPSWETRKIADFGPIVGLNGTAKLISIRSTIVLCKGLAEA